jgi:hypothetical protein
LTDARFDELPELLVRERLVPWRTDRWSLTGASSEQSGDGIVLEHCWGVGLPKTERGGSGPRVFS